MTIDLQTPQREKAILVGLKKQNDTKETIDDFLNELEMLADTAGADTIIKVIQDRAKPDPAYFIGKGKVEELSWLCQCNLPK